MLFSTCYFLVIFSNRWIKLMVDCLWNFGCGYPLALLTLQEVLEYESQFSDPLLHIIHRRWIFGWCHPGKRSSRAWGPCNLGGVLHLSCGIWRAVLWDVPLRLQKRNSESWTIQSMCALYLQWAQWDLWPWDRWEDDLWGLLDLNSL